MATWGDEALRGQLLDEPRCGLPRVVRVSPRGDLPGAFADSALTERAFDRESQHAWRGEPARTRTPAPAQSTRAAFSFMSPTAGHATTAQPLESARTSVPWPAWQTTTSQLAIVRERTPSR